MSRLVVQSVIGFVALCTGFWCIVHCRASDYEIRFLTAPTNTARCSIAQDGAQFMRQFAMFDWAAQLERQGTPYCLADFRQHYGVSASN